MNVMAVAQVKVCFMKRQANGTIIPDKDNIKLAAQHFLGESNNTVKNALTATMEGHQRQVLGTLTARRPSGITRRRLRMIFVA